MIRFINYIKKYSEFINNNKNKLSNKINYQN